MNPTPQKIDVIDCESCLFAHKYLQFEHYTFCKGTPSEFHEQTDLDGLNACQFLKLQKQLTGDEIDK